MDRDAAISEAGVREGDGLGALRRFARGPRVKKAEAQEYCELCGGAVGAEHAHLLEVGKRELVCACEACAILFGGGGKTKYRRVPDRMEVLGDFVMGDEEWNALGLPINLAFFYFSTAHERVVALYPSPAGATESLLEMGAWRELAAANPVLGELEADVEALLVNRVGEARGYYRVPIDQCFRLVGIIRAKWRGLSGGAEVWKAVAEFFTELEKRGARKAAGHA